MRAEARANEAPIHHVPRTLADEDLLPSARWSHKSTRGSTPARPSSGAAPSTWWLGASGSETSTAFEPGG